MRSFGILEHALTDLACILQTFVVLLVVRLACKREKRSGRESPALVM